MWRFRSNSVFDIANYYSATPVLLDEHFRSYPPIIDFSNQEFYGGRIRLMSKEIEVPRCLELYIVKNAKTDLDNTRNMAEAEKIMEKLQELIIEDTKNNPENPSSIGIISPFRAQVELIKKAIAQVFNTETIIKHQIEIGTAHTFQGDERDIMILSLTLAPNSHFQSMIFAQKPNLFNVAITRARKKLLCFISNEPQNIEQGLIRNYLEYIQKYSLNFEQDTKNKVFSFNNYIEQNISETLIQDGFQVISNFESAGFKIDLVITKDDKTLAVQVDGIEKPDKKEIWQQSILERCGWHLMRITAREWHYSPKVCIDRIKQKLG